VSEPVAVPDLEPFPDEWERALCVVAHPDDLEYGGAAAVARWTSEGRTVSYLLVTSGEAGIDDRPPAECGPLRREEQLASARAVGVDVVEFLDHPDGAVLYGVPLRRDIARAIRRHRPEVLLGINHRATWTDPATGGGPLNQADHRAVGWATIDAARDAGNRWIFEDLLAEGLEPWSGARWAAFASSPKATHAVDVTGHLDRGVASLRAHALYLAGLGRDFDIEEFLSTGAEAAGARLGVRHAVAFEVFNL
jgi:LmbE family N-acetylglucosaminyl deacetylase